MKLAVDARPSLHAQPAAPAVHPAAANGLIILQNSRYSRYSRFIENGNYQANPSTSADTYRGELIQHAVAAGPAVFEQIQADASSRSFAPLSEPAAGDLVLTAATPAPNDAPRRLKRATMCRGPPRNPRTHPIVLTTSQSMRDSYDNRKIHPQAVRQCP